MNKTEQQGRSRNRNPFIHMPGQPALNGAPEQEFFTHARQN